MLLAVFIAFENVSIYFKKLKLNELNKKLKQERKDGVQIKSKTKAKHGSPKGLPIDSYYL
jgi:hypothetical protein